MTDGIWVDHCGGARDFVPLELLDLWPWLTADELAVVPEAEPEAVAA